MTEEGSGKDTPTGARAEATAAEEETRTRAERGIVEEGVKVEDPTFFLFRNAGAGALDLVEDP